jgi:DnaJ-class molecular chaperone
MAANDKVKPDPIPIPLIKKMYAYCSHCGGTGKIYLTNGDDPPAVETCNWCGGAGKTEFGEIEP